MKRSFIKSIAILLSLIMICCFALTACNKGGENYADNSTIDTPIKPTPGDDDNPIISPPVIPDVEIVLPENATKNSLSYSYASISVDLMSYGYDVFNAYVETENGKEYGIAYTDYEEGYQFEGDNKTYIESGFLAFSSDESVSASTEALYANPVDEEANVIEDDNYGYIISIIEEGIPEGHFIADELYTKYSVCDGKVDIKTFENRQENYDLSLGTLYDYDKEEIVFIPYDEIDSSPVGYIPLTEYIDYEAIKTNLYAIVEEQTAKGYAIQSITISFLSVDTLNALRGVLSQTDSLNGYSFDDLDGIEFDNDSQYLHFNEDGSITIKELPPLPVTPQPNTQHKSIFDWIIDGLVLIGAGAIAVVSVTFLGPAGGIIAAGVIGAGIEYFNQTIIEGKKFSEVNWSKVGIMSVSGAIGAMVPCAGTLGFIAAGAVGGLTSAALTAVDGGSLEEVLISAGTGALTSMLMHGLFASCFPSGTQILTKEGYLPIELVTVGTLVASYNIYLNQMEWQPVLDTYTSYTSKLIEVRLSNGDSILSTTNHPYYVVSEKTYKEAQQLKTGDKLLAINGEVYVSSIKNVSLDSEIPVYNFNVDKNHNYFADESLILVHNTCGKYKKANIKKDGIDLGGAISKKQALERLRNGQDVFCSSKKAAKALVKDAFGNAKPYAEIHLKVNNAKWHFHDAFNHIFHVFFN